LTDFGTIGYIIGKYLGDKVPVIEGLPNHTTTNQLKALGAAAAGRGAVALYHCVGLTPEARTRKQALGGVKPEAEIRIGPKEIADALAEINTAKDEHFDAILLGCPHPHIEEIRELASLLAGKRVKLSVKFLVFISADVLALARHLDYAQIIEETGAEFVERDCILFFHIKDWGWKTVMTDSAKYANLLPSEPTCLDVIYKDTASCVAAATI
jgi:predicted aconitase